MKYISLMGKLVDNVDVSFSVRLGSAEKGQVLTRRGRFGKVRLQKPENTSE